MSDHTTKIELIYDKFGTASAEKGLGEERVRENLSVYGPNKLKGKKQRNIFLRFLDQMKDYMVLILLAAAVVSFVIAILEHEGSFIDPIIIIAIVIINGILGVNQESKAEKAIEALENMTSPTVKVVRGGIVMTIPSEEIVPGDVIILEAGDIIPADGRLIETASLKCDESALTGESVSVDKNANAAVTETAPLGDRFNMAYSGCIVTYGRGKMVATATGMDTEMGKIAGLISGEVSTLTPLQQKLNKMGKYIGFVAIGICAVIFVVGFFKGMAPMELFMTAVSLAVAAIPEGMTMVVTVVLALGVQRMVKKNAIMRRLPAVETLGSASVICSDKTGTLTQNKMTVKFVWPAGKKISEMSDELPAEALQVLRLGMMCNDGRILDDGEAVGDPTETSIIVAAKINGLIKDEIDAEFQRIEEIPFDSDRKLMTTVHKVNGKLLAITKGGYDTLLERCTSGERSKADEVNFAMGKNGLRVIACACKEIDELPEEITSEKLENDLTFIGLIGMIDPPREESRMAVATAKSAGIRTVMITGDHAVTASAIARQLGILEDGYKVMTGQELSAMSEEVLAESISDYSVYARVSPEDKIRIVKAWQKNGDVVAMTGDGVNDAPALKASDIGCAMGITGTDVAKGAADMVLTDDNFATIIEAVRSGRGIYDNIKKTIQFLLSSNLGEVITVFVAIILGWGSPLLAIHLLLVNLVTDAFPALALGLESVEDDIMDRKPVPVGSGIFADGLWIKIILQGFMIGALTLAGYYTGRFIEISPLFMPSHEVGMTMAFLVLSLSQLTQAINCRSRHSIFRVGFTTNKAMLQSVLISLAVVLMICLIPPLEALFKMVDLSVSHWLVIAGLSLMPFVIVEPVKIIYDKIKGR